MEKAYQFYQQCRAYLYSFMECYNEKVIYEQIYSNNQFFFFFIIDDNNQ
jgi:hypothetical protein